MIGSVARFFEAGYEVWRWEEVTDAWGGKTKQWVQRQDVEGRLRPLSGDKRLSADKETIFATHRFYCFPFAPEPVTDEAVTLTGTDPQGLSFKQAVTRDNAQVVENIVVTDQATPPVAYTVATDYTVSLDDNGYTTITRVATGTIADGETVLVSYEYAPGILPGDEIRIGGDRYAVKFSADMMTMGRLMQIDLEMVR